MKNTCKIKNCKNLIAVKKHGLCRGHLARFYLGKKVEGELTKYNKYKPYKDGK
jgi:hypothetical protein